MFYNSSRLYFYAWKVCKSLDSSLWNTNFLNFVLATYMSCMGYDLGKPIGNKPLSCTTVACKLIYSRAGEGGCMGGCSLPKTKTWMTQHPAWFYCWKYCSINVGKMFNLVIFSQSLLSALCLAKLFRTAPACVWEAYQLQQFSITETTQHVQEIKLDQNFSVGT